MAVVGSMGSAQGQPHGNNFLLIIYMHILIFSVYCNVVQMPQGNAGMGRQDVDLLINNQNGIINSVREVRYYLNFS